MLRECLNAWDIIKNNHTNKGEKMERKKSVVSILFLSICLFVSPHVIFSQTQEKNNFPALRGSYLGQKPPGKAPQVFAPGIISTDANEGCSCFSKDGQFFMFARAHSTLNGILIMQQVEGVWSKPQLAPFSAGKYDWDFMLAPDSKTVFVSSGRPLQEGASPEQDYRIWISEKTKEDWSVPYLLPPPVNTGEHDSYPSVTDDGMLYFFSNRKGGLGEGDIYRSRKVKNHYPEVENLDTPINTEYHEVDPFIAPNESYLIFCSQKPGGFGNADIYLTFRREDGSWTEPVNMGDKINSSYSEYIPYVTPDGKYLFFTSNKSGDRDIYWMDAIIIDELKPKEL